MHLNASHNGNSVYTVRTKVLFRRQSWGENKQTNMQFSVKGGNSQNRADYTFTYSLSKLPVPSPWPGPSPGLAAGTKPPLCVPALGSQPGRTLGRLRRGYDWGHLGEQRFFFRTGWWGVGRLSGGRNEWRMGCVWEPCPRPACPLVKRASALPICNADPSSCRLTLGKGASMAGIKQASADGKCHSHFDSWPPFFFLQTSTCSS